MSDANAHPLETILRLCEAAGPEPWYPKLHAEQTGVDRDSLDPPLDRLRLGGWLKLTDWMEGKGQGYRLTEQGQELVKDARAMAGVHEGKLPAPPARSVKVEDHAATAWDRGEAVREAFLGGEMPTATFVLIASCVLIYAAEQSAQKGGALEHWLQQGQVVYFAYIIDGQWWRLLTSAFFHGGPTHLLVNMFALYSLGGEAERLWGRGRFLTLYFLSALGGSVAVVLFTRTAALGSSGAICGLLAASAVWLLLNRHSLPPPFVAAWKRSLLINGVLIGVISLLPGISALGHLGGAVTGAVVAFLLDWQRFGNRAKRRLAYLGLIALPLLAIGSILVKERTDPLWRELSSLVGENNLLKEALAIHQRLVEPALKERDPAMIEQARAALGPLQKQAAGSPGSHLIDEYCRFADLALRDNNPLMVGILEMKTKEMRERQESLEMP